MTILLDQLQAKITPAMTVPNELKFLYEWIEEQGSYVDRPDNRTGFLFPLDELKRGSTDTERVGGTFIVFSAEGNDSLDLWLGNNDPEVLNRLCVFARTGSDGSMAAIWLDDDGAQYIVHLGSGSGSLLCCILAEQPIDFLRLLAIGYDEICCDEWYDVPPDHPDCISSLYVHPNEKYNEWLKAKFGVTIPRVASEIVRHLAHIGDKNSPDRFNCWVEKNSG